jgi:acyl dehydratase
MLELAGRRCCDTADVNDNGLSYFDDYVLGATYECGSVSVDQASIVAFGKEFDPQPFHVDPVAAAAGPYGGLIASGWHTAALVMRLLVDNYLSAESSLGSAKPDSGIIKTVVEAVNTDGQTVMRATAINFMLVRPGT